MNWFLIIILVISILFILLVIYYNRYLGSKNAIKLLNKYSEYIINKDKLFNSFNNIFINNKLFRLKYDENSIYFYDEIINQKELNLLSENEIKDSIFYLIPKKKGNAYFYFNELKRLSYFDFFNLINFNLLTKIISTIFLISIGLTYLTLENTLNLLGIPVQAILINTIDLVEQSLYNISFAIILLIIFISLLPIFIYLTIHIGSRIIYYLFFPIFYLYNINTRFTITKNKSKEIFLFTENLAYVLFFGIMISFLYLPTVSVIKQIFPYSVIPIDKISIIAGDYINATGYPKIVNDDNKKLYVVGYDNSGYYYFNLDKDILTTFKEKELNIKNKEAFCNDKSYIDKKYQNSKDKNIKAISIFNSFLLYNNIIDRKKAKQAKFNQININKSESLGALNLFSKDYINNICLKSK